MVEQISPCKTWLDDYRIAYSARSVLVLYGIAKVGAPRAENAWRFARRNAPLQSQKLRRPKDQNRGKQKVAWEPVRATIGWCIYGAIPTLRRCRSIPTSSPPTDRPVYHRFRIYPSIPPSPRSARFDDMLSNRQPRWPRTDHEQVSF